MDITIREMQSVDYTVILSLWNNELGNHSVNAENIVTDYERMSNNSDYKTFVALFENTVVGFITTVQVLAVGLPVGYLKINGLAVQKEYQHKGIGTELLKYVENFALEKDLSFIILNSGFKRTDAHGFYEQNHYDKDSYCFDKVLKQAK